MSGDFEFLAADLAGYALATGLALLIYFGPAAMLARWLATVRPASDWRGFAPALAFAILPVIDALVIRFGSVWAAAGLRVALLIIAVLWARAFVPRASALAAAGIAVWWLYLCAMYVDVDYGGALYQSVTALDLVKHAAVIREIGLGGLPVADPFFARPQAAGYYHYFYDGAAVIDLLGGRLVDARMAFTGAAFACGIAFAALLRALIVEFGAWRASSRRLTAFTIAACAIGGFDLVGIALRWGVLGMFERNPEWWDDEISFVPTSAVWVPHHLAAVIASFVALFLLTRAIESDRRNGALLAAFAGVAMASAFGLSIWVTLGAAAVIALSLRFLVTADRPKWVAAAAIAAVVALVLSVPQLIDLIGGRATSASPLALWIREPARIGELTGYPVNPLLALALTPPVWLLEFGLFALGAWWFWRSPELRGSGGRLGRVLLAAAVGALLLNLLVRSAIINNDFGWRVAWFAALPAMIWTITVIGRDPGGRDRRAVAAAGALALGLGVTVFAVIVGRAPAAALPRHSLAFINADPEIDLALRHAYEWAGRHLPPRALLQHNPVAAPRTLDFGLYGRNPTMVADYEAELFGATEREVHGRAHFFGQIFNGRRPFADAGAVHLVVTDRDRLWHALDPGTCVYRRPHVCITRKALP